MTKSKFSWIIPAILALLFFAGDSFLNVSTVEARSRRAAAEEEEEYADEEVTSEDENADSEEAGDDEYADEEEEEFDPDAPIPDPERISGARLQTKDNTLLSATYYPGNRGKKTVPVIILHDWNSERKDVEVLAQELQANGCAVLVPDLRGHGKSNRYLIDAENTETFKAGKKFTMKDMQEIVNYDLPCLKKFLMQQNNSGQLNIDKLCVGGVGYGGLIAAFYANADWNPMVKRKKSIPSMGDVKGFFMVTPPKKIKGLDLISSIQYPTWRESISCIVVGGESSKKVLKSTEGQIRKFCGKDALERCWFRDYEVKENGAELIQDPEADAVLDILAFVDLRCIKRDILWKRR